MRKGWQLPLVIGFGCIVLVCLFDMAFQLAFGWALFLHRVGPLITIDLLATMTALVCLVFLSVGLHLFLRWLYGTIRRAKAGESSASRWRMRWTGMILALVFSMFVAGISAVGLSHQLVWLLSARESIHRASGGGREIAARMGSSNNLRNLGYAAHHYHTTNNAFPPGGTFDAHGNALHGWQTLLLPYLEQDNIFNEIDRQKAWTDPRNTPSFRRVVEMFLHTAGGEQRDEAGFGLSHYAANVRLLGGAKPRTMESITDGTANTILAGEVSAAYKPWGHPANWRDPARGIHTTPDSFGSPLYSDSVQFVMADGSVRKVSNKVSLVILRAISTPDGGEDVSEGW